MLCLGTHGADARPVADAEALQRLPMQPAHRLLQVLRHTDQKVAPKLFPLVVLLQMGVAVRSQTHQAGLDCRTLGGAEVTWNLSGF